MADTAGHCLTLIGILMTDTAGQYLDLIDHFMANTAGRVDAQGGRGAGASRTL